MGQVNIGTPGMSFHHHSLILSHKRSLTLTLSLVHFLSVTHTHYLSLCHSLPPSLSHTLSLSHSHSLSLFLSHTHSLSPSLSLTHTHTQVKLETPGMSFTDIGRRLGEMCVPRTITAASIYHTYSEGPSIRSICTRLCFTMTNMIWVCSDFAYLARREDVRERHRERECVWVIVCVCVYVRVRVCERVCERERVCDCK